MADRNESTPSRLEVAGVVSFYMVAALVMVFVNKAVLNSTPDLPFSFLFIQLFIAVILLHVGSLIFSSPLGSSLPVTVELPTFDINVFRKLIPVVSVGVLGLALNTLCLRGVDASFFQIARGLLLPLTILVSAVQSGSFPRGGVLQAATIVTGGFFVGVSPSSYFSSHPALDVSILPLIYGFLSSLMTAIHAVLVKSAYAHVGGSVIKLTYWTSVMSALALIPFIGLNGEIPLLLEYITNGGEPLRVFVIGSAITGIFGFALCMAGIISIKVTSPITHMFSSAARSVLQTVLGVIIFGDVIVLNRASSILVITSGTLYYTWVKSGGGVPPPPKQPEPDLEKQQKE